MSGGEAPKKRGRPKGSVNKRSTSFKGYIDARFGGSAAQQSAALCMVTPAELKRAGGSMAQAQVLKALDLVRRVRDATDRLDGELQQLVRGALEEMLALHDQADTKGRRGLVDTFIKRVQHLGGEFGLTQALKLMADERAALLPYTDQRQPLAVEVAGAAPPAVIFMGSAPAPGGGASTEIIGEFQVLDSEVSRAKSHDEGQAVEPQGVLTFDAADGKSEGAR